MIPVSVSDLLKILDQIPIWKAVAGLPKRLAELERRINDLESQLGQATAKARVPDARLCPICGATMRITQETGHPTFSFAGLKVHHMECPECGNAATRNFKPGKGYE